MARFTTLRRLITRSRRAIQRARGRPAPVSRNHLPLRMTVGRDCHIYTNQLDGRFGRYITLGDEVVLAGRSKIICHDAARGGQTGVYLTAPVKIGSRTYIGADATVLPGVTIGEDVVVGAGSVVTRDVPDGAVVAGSPARQVGTSADLDKKRLALLDSLPVFDPGLYNVQPVPPDRLDELDRAVRVRGGYVLLDRAEHERGRARRGELND